MNKLTYTVVFSILLIASSLANAATVPEPFQGFDNDSKYVITYDDLTGILKVAVVDTGMSTREVATPTQATTGTRMKAKVKRSTSNEGNRFYFETFEKNEDARQLLAKIRDSLVAVPDEAPLQYFSRDEQLAYWLNLYNVTLLNEIVAIYPKRDLKKILTGKNSILPKKLITVAGVPLSLNDIQYTILAGNYDNDPMVMYGLYQGVIGGPNIRKRAYTGSDVKRALKNNAFEFINSNRGTFSQDAKTFKVSSLYKRNERYFPDFNDDLTAHLLVYLEGYERDAIQSASKLKADINDWTVTDLGGTRQNIGGSFASNNAALLDSVKSTVQSTNTGGGSTLAASAGYGSASMASKGKPYNRIDPELLEQLHVINEKRKAENVKNATVTLEELGEVAVEEKPDTKPDPDGNEKN